MKAAVAENENAKKWKCFRKQISGNIAEMTWEDGGWEGPGGQGVALHKGQMLPIIKLTKVMMMRIYHSVDIESWQSIGLNPFMQMMDEWKYKFLSQSLIQSFA